MPGPYGSPDPVAFEVTLSEDVHVYPAGTVFRVQALPLGPGWIAWADPVPPTPFHQILIIGPAGHRDLEAAPFHGPTTDGRTLALLGVANDARQAHTDVASTWRQYQDNDLPELLRRVGAKLPGADRTA